MPLYYVLGLQIATFSTSSTLPILSYAFTARAADAATVYAFIRRKNAYIAPTFTYTRRGKKCLRVPAATAIEPGHKSYIVPNILDTNRLGFVVFSFSKYIFLQQNRNKGH